MSRQIAVIPRENIVKIALVEAAGRAMARVKADTGCTYIINSWLYNMSTGRAVGNLKIDGSVKADAGWNSWGLTWDSGPDIKMAIVPDEGGRSYLSGVELLTPGRGPGADLDYPAEYGGARGRSAVLLAGEYVALCCVGDGTADAETPERLRDELVELGTRYAPAGELRALGLDGGGSSQCDFDCQTITSSRRVAGYLCVWTKQAETPPDKEEDTAMCAKIVCLDPGHGPGNVNASPDGRYKEHQFCWDMYTRIRPLLEKRGVSVVCTRAEDTVPTLTQRAETSNRAGADCFVSIHSNAAGNSGWYDASGLEIYTSQGPMTAARNVLASALADAFRQAGVGVRSEPVKHQGYTVLTKTDAPAVLIEYGFHTSREDVELLLDTEYRDKLAQATAEGVCAWLGVAWEGEQAGEAEPWYAGARAWAVELGIADGTRPMDGCTRAEVWTMLQRLYDAVKAGK